MKIHQIICHTLFFTFLILIFHNCSSNSNNENVINEISDSTNVNLTNKDGLKNGEWVSYFDNGKVQSICHFKNGIPDGSIVVYNDSSQEVYRGNFKSGKKVGEWIFTNPHNNLQTVKNYSSSK
jgi:antitoxin component YwqK of YwqJK toxin-antitoxin module